MSKDSEVAADGEDRLRASDLELLEKSDLINRYIDLERSFRNAHWDDSQNRERMRQRIAFVLLGILAGTIFSTFVAYGLEATNTIKPLAGQGVRELLTLILPPLVGLVGAATGFYYGTSGSSDSNR